MVRNLIILFIEEMRNSSNESQFRLSIHSLKYYKSNSILILKAEAKCISFCPFIIDRRIDTFQKSKQTLLAENKSSIRTCRNELFVLAPTSK